MHKLIKYAQHFTKLELMKARLEVFQNESGREGVDFIIRTNSGNYHELYLQPINLENDRSVKIPKQDLGEPKDNLWIALVLLMKEMEPMLYLIPSTQLTKPDITFLLIMTRANVSAICPIGKSKYLLKQFQS